MDSVDSDDDGHGDNVYLLAADGTDPASLTLHIQSDDEDFWIDDSRWYTGADAPPVVSAIDAQGKVATTWGSLKSR